jgi:hypothetical protein
MKDGFYLSPDGLYIIDVELLNEYAILLYVWSEKYYFLGKGFAEIILSSWEHLE